MTSVTKLAVMLAKEFEMGMTIKKDDSKFREPPEGWWASEKFDGYRAQWMND